MRSPFLTAASEKVLRLMVEAQDTMDGELVCDGLEVWVGMHRTNRAVLNSLLLNCLIRGPETNGGTEIYRACEESRAILENPSYQPMIRQHLSSHAS